MSSIQNEVAPLLFMLVLALCNTGSLNQDSQKTSHENYFLGLLFNRYGNNGLLTFEGFEHLLENLGIGNLSIADHDVHDHFVNSGIFKLLHSSHYHFEEKNHHKNVNSNNTSNLTVQTGQHHHYHENLHSSTNKTNHITAQGSTTNGSVDSHGHQHGHDHTRDQSGNSHNDHRKHKHKRKRKHQKTSSDIYSSTKHLSRYQRSVPADYSTKCLTAQQILNTYSVHFEKGISKKLFLSICPAIIYQIDTHACNKPPPCPDFHAELHCEQYHHHDDSHPHHHDEHNETMHVPANIGFFDIPLKVWGYASASVLVISLVGLLGVAVVPLMQMIFYHHVIQFLVALAVGTLTGDALLHLLPHALVESDGGGHDHEGEGHSKEGIWKGLTALSGMYIFFLAEKLLDIVSKYRQKRKVKKSLYFKARGVRPNRIAVRLSRHRDRESRDLSQYEHVMMVQSPGTGTDVIDELVDDDVMHGGRGHSHDEIHDRGHGHGHSHEIPTSVASVAWMVIMGDGLHNFTDGIAIGAAFSRNFTGGLSTSIAIFCHELPHELGDFAMLLKAGMSVKQALMYNIVSSVLAFIGMVIGVAVGNIDGVSLWIFSLIGGLFLYIALVDMFPEMTKPAEGGMGKWCQLLLQNGGLLVGMGIMLVIALYEDKIKIPLNDP